MTQLTDEARDILKRATDGNDDTIMLLTFLSEGTVVQVAGKNITEGATPRTAAMYRHAVQQLEQEGLIEDRAGKGEVFFVTGPGYQMAGLLETA